jgi:hypothetical protein
MTPQSLAYLVTIFRVVQGGCFGELEFEWTMGQGGLALGGAPRSRERRAPIPLLDVTRICIADLRQQNVTSGKPRIIRTGLLCAAK